MISRMSSGSSRAETVQRDVPGTRDRRPPAARHQLGILNESVRAFRHGLLASVAFFVTPAARDRCEGLTRVGEDNGCARCRLIASDDDIDLERIELDAATHPSGTLGGYQGRPGAEEGVENNIATVR